MGPHILKYILLELREVADRHDYAYDGGEHFEDGEEKFVGH